MPLEQMLRTINDLGVYSVELTTGNWGKAAHLDLDALLKNETEFQSFCDTFRRHKTTISALNCSGNPIACPQDLIVTRKTFELAEKLGIRKIVMMSGLPAGSPDDSTPVWVTTSWPPVTSDILKYQWSVAFPFWERLAQEAKNCGIEKIALENHGWQLVYNVETLFRLRKEIGSIIGMNLDPGHLFWMGGDPVCAVRKLGKALYHIHGKDARLERGVCGVNGVLDTKPVEQFGSRSWNYVAVGCGHDLQWWKEFFSVVRMTGYDGPVSLEMEDPTMDALTGVRMSVSCLRQALGYE